MVTNIAILLVLVPVLFVFNSWKNKLKHDVSFIDDKINTLNKLASDLDTNEKIIAELLHSAELMQSNLSYVSSMITLTGSYNFKDGGNENNLYI